MQFLLLTITSGRLAIASIVWGRKSGTRYPTYSPNVISNVYHTKFKKKKTFIFPKPPKQIAICTLSKPTHCYANRTAKLLHVCSGAFNNLQNKKVQMNSYSFNLNDLSVPQDQRNAYSFDICGLGWGKEKYKGKKYPYCWRKRNPSSRSLNLFNSNHLPLSKTNLQELQ